MLVPAGEVSWRRRVCSEVCKRTQVDVTERAASDLPAYAVFVAHAEVLLCRQYVSFFSLRVILSSQGDGIVCLVVEDVQGWTYHCRHGCGGPPPGGISVR